MRVFIWIFVRYIYWKIVLLSVRGSKVFFCLKFVLKCLLFGNILILGRVVVIIVFFSGFIVWWGKWLLGLFIIVFSFIGLEKVLMLIVNIFMFFFWSLFVVLWRGIDLFLFFLELLIKIISIYRKKFILIIGIF